MKGAIIGDVVGSVYEFNNTFNYNFPLLSEESTFTDDTICTIAIADAFLNKKPYAQTLKAWCRKYPNPKGSYGTLFNSWIFSDNPNYKTNSYGNGALMRLSPIGLADIPVTQAIINTQKATTCSHDHEKASFCANVQVMLLRKLRLHKNKEDVSITMKDAFGSQWNRFLPLKGSFTDTCQNTLPLAAHLFFQSSSFEDAIRLAVSYGGDSDTLAAIVGGMAEAYYGVPEELWFKVEKLLPESMLKIIDQFYGLFT